ncbi:MAG: ribokinase [Clostridia bacterium]|nr:ribokinase [Clostridia bacterium]
MYKNIRAAVVGSINMDLILNMKKVPDLGENLLGTNYGYANGGKGANQATALANLGASVRMIGKVADDENGKALMENLKIKDIDVSGIDTNGSQTGLAVIILDGEGRNRIVVYEGANAEIDKDCAVKSLVDYKPDLLLVQFETNEDVVVGCVNEAIKNNITTVIDCGPAKAFSLEKMQGADIISPNESETEALTGIYPDSDENILKASKILKERSRAKFVVLKLGDRGCAVYDGEELKSLPPYKTTVVDTTAAGDCFTGAMALEYLKSGDIYTACDMGNKAGAIAVSRMGAEGSMPTIEEILSI